MNRSQQHPYEVGDKVKITSRPKQWSSHFGNKSPLGEKFPMEITITKIEWTDDYWAMEAGGFHWSLSSLLEGNHIEMVQTAHCRCVNKPDLEKFCPFTQGVDLALPNEYIYQKDGIIPLMKEYKCEPQLIDPRGQMKAWEKMYEEFYGSPKDWNTYAIKCFGSDGDIIKPKKKSIMNKVSTYIKNRLLSADEKLLRKYGLHDECGQNTMDAKDAILERIFNTDKNQAYLVEIAKGLEAEAKANK